jgi:hypothetical protein
MGRPSLFLVGLLRFCEACPDLSGEVQKTLFVQTRLGEAGSFACPDVIGEFLSQLFYFSPQRIRRGGESRKQTMGIL